MIFLKSRNKLHSYNFRGLKILLLILCSFFINYFLCNPTSANNNTYNVILPQKIDGIEKIEYFINDAPYGSTAGTTSIELTEEAKLNFSVRFESFGYTQTKVKDIKIISNNNDPLTLNIYGYDENGNITTFEPEDDATINPDQTYISSPIWISSSDTFSFSNVEMDKFNVIINLSDSSDLIDESLKVKCHYTNNELFYASVDYENNTLKIPNLTLNSSIKLWFDPTSAYSNSVINVYKSGEKLTPNESDNGFDIYIDSADVYIEVSGIKKNKYILNFTASDDTSFKFKNKNSDTDLIQSDGTPITTTHGDNYCFTCESPNLLNETHEVTVNNNVIKPENGIYNLNNISENLTISVTEKTSAIYNISLESILNFFDVTDTQNIPILNGSVKYSDSFKFKVSAKEAYTQEEHNILIYAVPISVPVSENSDEQLEPYLLTPSLEGIYTTPSVTEPMVIIARNINKNLYKITLPEKISGASYKVTENENVTALSANQFQITHGESLEISLFAETGYDVTDAELLTNNKSAKILKNGTTYTLQNVTSDTYLVVNGVQNAKCKVTFEGEGFVFRKLNNSNLNLSETSLDYESGELTFKIELAEGYELTNSNPEVSISEGEGTLTPPSEEKDYYTLSNVHSDVKLSATGAELITLTVTISTDNENLEFKSVDSESTLPTENSVKYGENFTFEVVNKNNEPIENLQLLSSSSSTPIKISETPLTYSLNSVSANTEVSTWEYPLLTTDDFKQERLDFYKPVYADLKQIEIDYNYLYSLIWLPAKRLIVCTDEGEIMKVHWTSSEDRNQEGSEGASLALYCEPIDGRKMTFKAYGRNGFTLKREKEYKFFHNKDEKKSIMEDVIDDGKIDEKTLEEAAAEGRIEKISLSDAHLSYGYDSKEVFRKWTIIDQSYYNNINNFKDLTDYTTGKFYEEIMQTVSTYENFFGIFDDNNNYIGMKLTYNGLAVFRYLFNELILQIIPDSMNSYNAKFDFEASSINDFKIYPVKSCNTKTMEVTLDEAITNEFGNTTYNVNGQDPAYFVLELDDGFEYDNLEFIPDHFKEGSKYFPKLNLIGQVSGNSNQYLYELSNVYEENPTIQINGVKKKEYTVSCSENTGTKLQFGSGDENLTTTVKHGDTLKITSRPLDGYEYIESYLQITSGNNSQEIDLSELSTNNSISPTLDGIPLGNLTIYRAGSGANIYVEYTLGNIQGDINIVIRRNLKLYTITFPEVEGLKFRKKNDLSSLDNSEIKTSQLNFSFLIEAENGYGTSNIIVTANGVEIQLRNGYYTIDTQKLANSQDHIEIKVPSGLSKIKHVVSFTPYENVTYKNSEDQIILDEVEVDYGDNYSFSVSVSGAYSNSNIQVKLSGSRSNDTQLESDDATNLYTISNITENYRIYIEGLELNEYKLKFRISDDVDYYDQYGVEKLTSDENTDSEFITKIVNYGETFGFKILANEGIDISELNVWYAYSSSSIQSSNRILPVSDVYYIENITNDVVVHVGNTKSINYQVEIRTTEGVKCLDSSGEAISSQISVSHGESLSFTLSLDPAYSNASPIASIKGSTNVLTPSSNGVYTLENITENKIIEITNVIKNTYRIKFKETEGVIYRTVKNKTFTEYLDAEYGDVQQFKISLMDAYDQSSPIVLLNNTKVLVQNGGIYTIERVEADLEVTVENVVKNPEETTIEDINDVPESIISSADIDKVVAATKTYEALPEEQKILVTNTSGLNAAQEEAKTINHTSNDVTVTGIDWNIKLIVTPLTHDQEAMESFNAEIERRTLLSLYEMKLLNLLTNEYYEVPYGQEVSVTIPCGNLEEYENIVVAHKNSGGGIEYLDVNINENTASFKTSSFSQFGIAGKKIPNYSENPSDLKISVAELVENEDELKNLLGEGLTSQLGELINLEENESETSTNLENNSSSSNPTDSQYLGSTLNKIYLWFINNEFISVIIILLLGLLIILLILLAGKKKKED